MTLTFDADTHRYYWNGQLVPGVSTVLGVVYGDTYMYATPDFGTTVHKLCERHDLGLPLNLDGNVRDDFEAQGCIDSWMRFRAEREFMPWFIEEPLYNSLYRYAGTVDRIGTLGDSGEWAVVDIKTGQPSAWHGLQLAAYLMAAADMGLIPPEAGMPRRLGVYLRPGSYEVREYAEPGDGTVFKAALMIHNWRLANA